MRNRLAELLPDTSTFHTDIVIEPTLAGAAPELMERIGFSGKRLLVVCDANTLKACGARIMQEVAAYRPHLLAFDESPHADKAALAGIESHGCDALIAVGSGTISDLCKYASSQAGLPYAVFATAPSMNGYLSANASLTLEGIKQSKAAQLPVGVFCDLEVMAAAPIRMLRSGLGDSLCRSTAQIDWLLSHLLLGTPYSSLPFDLLLPFEAELFACASRLAHRDRNAVELLVKTLLVSGIGMTLSGGSYPASQGEHMIAHTMEMKHGSALPETLHGEQVGVTTLTMAKIQQELLAVPLRLPPCPPWEDKLASYFGRQLAREIAPNAENKYQLYDQADILAGRLMEHEMSIRDALRRVMVPETRLREVLCESGSPTSASELGWDDKDYELAIAHARFTRDRFTFLDLARN